MWPLILLGGALFIYSGLQAKDLADQLQTRLLGVSIVKKGINIFSSALIIKVELINATPGSIKINSLSGSVLINGSNVADFNYLKSFVIPSKDQGGKVQLDINAIVSNTSILSTLLNFLTTKKTPEVKINLKVNTLGTSLSTVIPLVEGQKLTVKNAA